MYSITLISRIEPRTVYHTESFKWEICLEITREWYLTLRKIWDSVTCSVSSRNKSTTKVKFTPFSFWLVYTFLCILLYYYDISFTSFHYPEIQPTSRDWTQIQFWVFCSSSVGPSTLPSVVVEGVVPSVFSVRNLGFGPVPPGWPPRLLRAPPTCLTCSSYLPLFCLSRGTFQCDPLDTE